MISVKHTEHFNVQQHEASAISASVTENVVTPKAELPQKFPQSATPPMALMRCGSNSINIRLHNYPCIQFIFVLWNLEIFIFWFIQPPKG